MDINTINQPKTQSPSAVPGYNYQEVVIQAEDIRNILFLGVRGTPQVEKNTDNTPHTVDTFA